MNGEAGSRRIIALLGRRDFPTDGVEDYCAWLGRALAAQGWTLELVRVPWAERGWLGSLRWLRRQSPSWRGRWVLVQYTALNWSRRGFPFGFLAVLRALKGGGTRRVVVFHDVTGYSGPRWIDRLRRVCQQWVMRTAYRWAEQSILTLPPEKVPWLPGRPRKAAFIPAGANIPEPPEAVETHPDGAAKTVAVFGVTGGRHIPLEVADIAYAVNRVAKRFPGLRLLVFGREAEKAEETLKGALNGARIRLSVRGVLPAEEVSRTLSAADVLLFVRGHISTRRGSAIAGIACGLPVIGYQGPETCFPITEAGAVLVPQGDREALAEALERVLGDEEYRRELCRRSRRAQRDHFSWSAIAGRYFEVLDNG